VERPAQRMHNRGTMDWLARLKQAKAFLKEMGYERERAAVALLSLSFFGILYFLVALNAPPGWAPVFAGLMICYLTAFLALAAQWFWARWFASGLGWSGFMLGLMSLVMIGWHPSLAVYTVLHGIIVATLLGQKMSSRYEQQTAWRERYAMDEYGVARLGKAVTRGAASLPTLIMWALAPREGDQMLLLGGLALVLAIGGLSALVRMRSWGLLALGGSAAALLAVAATGSNISLSVAEVDLPTAGLWALQGSPAIGVAWVTLALLPFALPVLRYLRRG
jgi:hypothetical protein